MARRLDENNEAIRRNTSGVGDGEELQQEVAEFVPFSGTARRLDENSEAVTRNTSVVVEDGEELRQESAKFVPFSGPARRLDENNEAIQSNRSVVSGGALSSSSSSIGEKKCSEECVCAEGPKKKEQRFVPFSGKKYSLLD